MKNIKQLHRWVWFLGLLLFIIFAVRWSQSTNAEPDSPSITADNWADPFFLTTSITFSSRPILKSDSNGNLMVVYSQEDNGTAHTPYYRIWIKSTNSWSTQAPINQNASKDLVSITFDFDSSNIAHAVWVSQDDPFSDGGSVLYQRQNLWPNNPKDISITALNARDPAIAVGNNNHLHVVWSQSVGFNPRQIYYTTSSNNGVTWTTPVALTSSPTNSLRPALTTDSNNNVHLVWKQETVSGDIQINYLKRTGTTWGTIPLNITPITVTEAEEPSIIADGNIIHVAFANRVSPGGSDFTAHHSKFTPGSGWTTEQMSNGALFMNTADPAILAADMVICDSKLFFYYHGSPIDNSTSTREQILGKNNPGTGWSPEEFATVESSGSRAIRPSMACSGTVVFTAFESITGSNPHRIAIISQQETIYLPVVRR